jgi:hypothetical protein
MVLEDEFSVFVWYDSCSIDRCPWGDNRNGSKHLDGDRMMTDKRTQENASDSNMQKDPDNWTTGDEQMTGAQRSYLKTLSEEAGEEYDDNLTKAEASKKIDELQAKTGRGTDQNGRGRGSSD